MRAVVAVVVLALGCGDDRAGVDAPMPADAHLTDAPRVDAAIDAAEPDATVDASIPDAAALDAPVPDAPAPDAAPPDAPIDAAFTDAIGCLPALPPVVRDQDVRLDLNGDGYIDEAIIVGSPPPQWPSYYHRVEVYRWTAAGRDPTPYQVLPDIPNQGWTSAGLAIWSAGDINRDGIAELMIWMGEDGGNGTLLVYPGSPNGISGFSTFRFTQTYCLVSGCFERYGWAQPGADFDHDGFYDVPMFVDEAGYPLRDLGGISIMYGAPAPADFRSTSTFLLPPSAVCPGQSMYSYDFRIGDYDCDGYLDILAYSPDCGHWFVHRGTPTGVEATPSASF